MSLQTRRLLECRRSRMLMRTHRSDRRGVLLMVVLSMLALFLLLGTAFLVSSQFYADTAKEASKLNRTENNPADLLERAMLQVLRDSNNPNSAIRYHSLLRDVYGNDGFIGQVYPAIGDGYNAEYSGATASGLPYGPTEGQFIDIYVADLVSPNNELPSARHAIKLERNADGSAADLVLPSATDYYAGCLLTILTGPASGQTTRIIGYDLIGVTPQNDPMTGQPAPVYRLRVMSFAQSDGQALLPVDLASLSGEAFMVNGRAHNGTGAGYNRLAAAGTPRLSAVEAVIDSGGNPIDFQEIALTPNYSFFPTGVSQFDRNTGLSRIGHFDSTAGFQTFGSIASGQILYPTAEGPGGSDESYDAVDYQNMFLAHMPLTPRAQGGLLRDDDAIMSLGVDSQSYEQFVGGGQTRFDLEDTIVPSFHRPALVNYWYHRMLNSAWLSGLGDENQRARAILQPYEVRPIGDPAADAIVALKRKISLRPILEDHPNFDGSNPASRYSGTLAPGDVSQLAASGQIRFPFWEAVGPWDVDNDNDSINDSVWVDLGDAVQETENGTLYKPLYAFLVVDLDNRLNLNVHGSPDHFANTDFDPFATQAGVTNVGNLTGIGATSNVMPVGMGWGPGDIVLRSILSPPTQPYSGSYTLITGNPNSDDYARLFYGRTSTDPLAATIWGRMGTTQSSIPIAPGRTFDVTDIAATREPSVPFDFVGYPEVSQLTAQNVYATAVASNDAATAALWAPQQRSSFATEPDLRGRWATGVDYTGQPVYEVNYDATLNFAGVPVTPLLDDSPYETNASSNSRRGLPGAVTIDDDALFATSEMERVLRAYDAESGTAPSRLYDIVDAFDPNKYVLTVASDTNNLTPEELALAQVNTAINRQQVTTDSYEVPVPASAVPSYITELGPDGAPGIAGVDDDNQDSDRDGTVEDDVTQFSFNFANSGQPGGEIGWVQVDTNNPRFLSSWTDDFASYTGKSVTDARLVDVVWYRIQRNREQRGLPLYNWAHPESIAALNNICDQLLPPEVLAGYKMDINRPFGDGQDNNGNGVVDEPLEAGEPYLDDGNGIFVDLNGNGVYDPPLDNLWAAQLGGAGVALDHVMGKDVSGRGSYEDLNGNGIRDYDNSVNPPQLEPLIQPGNPILRDDAHLARQLYARHLYVLMLVLMDENYLAPYDPSDPSVRGYLRIKSRQLGNTPEAKVEAQRRYTCRQVAQWAVNCVDFRDSDASNTPFEFDMNPWDGWNTVNDNGSPGDPTDDTYFPLDGDATTDENHAQIIDWGNMAADGVKVITNSVPTWGNNGNQLDDRNATRGIVWGAERPELLISETAAFHDLRLEDLATASNEGDNTTQDGQQNQQKPIDDDLDQRLEPRGSLYVEVYNPWSGDAPRPVELYRHGLTRRPEVEGTNAQPNNTSLLPLFDKNESGDIDPNDVFHWADLNGNRSFEANERIEGVLLDRLSDAGQFDPTTNKVRRSPVWRIIVVEEHPGYHSYTKNDVNQTARDNNESHVGNLNQGNHNPFLPLEDYRQVLNATDQERQQIPYISPVNMDWDEMYFNPIVAAQPQGNTDAVWPASQWQQERTDEQNVNANDPKNEQKSFDKQLFAKPYPYIEREFYFTSAGTEFLAQVRDPANGRASSRGRATSRTYSDIEIAELRDLYDDLNVRVPFNFIRLGSQRFTQGTTLPMVSMAHRFIATEKTARRPDVPIAPIMPGRYGVIGDAGTVYPGARETVTVNGVDRFRFVTTVGRVAAQGAGAIQAQTDDNAHLTAIDGTRRFEMRPSPNPLEQQWMVASNGGVLNGPDQTARYNELMNLNASGKNMTTDGANAGPDAVAEVMAPAVVVPVDDMNVSEPAYGYGVRTRELAQLEADSGDTGQKWETEAANGEGAFVDGGGNDVHFDTPFDDDPEFVQARRRPVTLKKYRVVHLQRLADPTMPWNPPPGFNAADNLKRGAARHDAALPVNPYLTVDSASVDLTIFNGCSSVNIQAPQGDTLYRSTERMHHSRRSLGTGSEVPQRAVWGQDTFMATENVLPATAGETGLAVQNRRDRMAQDAQTEHRVTENHFDFMFRHSLGLPNEAAGNVYMQPELAPDPIAEDPTDINNTAGLAGPAAGAPRPDGAIASTYPWLNWNNRPFVSENELLQVPAWSSMEMLRKFSTMNTATNDQVNSYEGGWVVRKGPNDTDPIDAERTNIERYKRMSGNFGHLLNMMQSSSEASRIEFDPANGEPACIGAPNFHRILDYVHTPSRFVATDTLLNPVAFSANNVASLDDPRAGNLAPFNRVPNYREPGKINLNTIRGQRLAGSGLPTLWSDVFDGLMHRVRDDNVYSGGTLQASGHFGPAWRDLVLSRRGYIDPILNGSATGVDRVELVLNNNIPTFFSNPFRSSEAGDLSPITGLVNGGVDVSMLRSHPFRPGANYAWGTPGNDDDSNGLVSDAREAGLGEGPAFSGGMDAPVPLFSELCATPAIDATRNSAMHYMPLTRLDNLTTTRSGVFAIWVTVGYFEVTPAPEVDWTNASDQVRQKFVNQTGDTTDPPTQAQALYNRVYPQGYQLGKELGSETGDIDRHRAFYIIDRTRPVAFKPGEDVNVEDAILLRRRID